MKSKSEMILIAGVGALVVSIIVLLIAGYFSQQSKLERSILNGYYYSGMSIPSWIVIPASNKIDWENPHSQPIDVKYGLGGRTCFATVTFIDDKHINETNKECYH